MLKHEYDDATNTFAVCDLNTKNAMFQGLIGVSKLM